MALGLGSLSIPAIVLANMALQDIYHQEADVALEWGIVRVAFVVILAFHIVAIRALWAEPLSRAPEAARPTV
jgi:hypothetical protein